MAPVLFELERGATAGILARPGWAELKKRLRMKRLLSPSPHSPSPHLVLMAQLANLPLVLIVLAYLFCTMAMQLQGLTPLAIFLPPLRGSSQLRRSGRQ